MNILKDFIKEYQEFNSPKEEIFEKSLEGDIKKVMAKLLDEKFLPSIQLKATLDKLLRRAKYPMEIAITGQFSSGKSTFLNALLSKNILPTGITPVTSKVNFINYSEEYKLRITYNSGAQELASIDKISEFTDQRVDNMKDIKYLTLYAPVPILKEISFVDTPGLNSQSQSDTDTTKKVLRDVGGIIWLALIDNAGKMSEMEILDEYMGQFKNKSLCVLNQKDKLTDEQVKTTTQYIEKKFGNYFSQVTPISAKMALESRSSHSDILLQEEHDKITNEFKNIIEKENLGELNDFHKEFNIYQDRINTIKDIDTTNNDKMLEESNIKEVLDFIENTIKPQAAENKEFTIKKDLKQICDILINSNNTIATVYDVLIDILKETQDETLASLDDLQKIYAQKLMQIYNSLKIIIEKIATQIHQNIKKQKSTRYENKPSLINKNKFEQIEYNGFFIDSDAIYKGLFYDDQTIEKMFKRTFKELTQIEEDSAEAYLNIYRNIIKYKVRRWQTPYELIRKNREISSDREFSITRHFAAKVYQNILKDYHRSTLSSISTLHKEFSYFNGALSHSYMQITKATIAHFDEQLVESTKLYEKEPTKFSLNHPTEDEILKRLKSDFSFEKIEHFFTDKKNYLYKSIQKAKTQYVDISKDRISFIENAKNKYTQNISSLNAIKEDI